MNMTKEERDTFTLILKNHKIWLKENYENRTTCKGFPVGICAKQCPLRSGKYEARFPNNTKGDCCGNKAMIFLEHMEDRNEIILEVLL